MEHAKTANRPFISAYRQRGYVWDGKGQPLIPIHEPLDTRTSPAYMIPAHSFYGFPSALFGTPESYLDLQPIEIPDDVFHRVDIDTEDDLAIARALYQSGQVQ